MRGRFILSVLFSFSIQVVLSQTYVTKSILEFGAKGDGKTNDHEAFVKAASFFTQRKGHGKLIIPRGIYIVGKQ